MCVRFGGARTAALIFPEPGRSSYDDGEVGEVDDEEAPRRGWADGTLVLVLAEVLSKFGGGPVWVEATRQTRHSAAHLDLIWMQWRPVAVQHRTAFPQPQRDLEFSQAGGMSSPAVVWRLETGEVRSVTSKMC